MGRLNYSESIIIAASAEGVYDVVSDITRTGKWSPVCTACWWHNEAEQGEGAWFSGRNESNGRTWQTDSQVETARRGREFSWLVGGSYVRWTYSLEAVDGGTRLTESWEFLPAGIDMFHRKYGSDAQAQIDERTEAARVGIPATLRRIKSIVEAA